MAARPAIPTRRRDILLNDIPRPYGHTGWVRCPAVEVWKGPLVSIETQERAAAGAHRVRDALRSAQRRLTFEALFIVSAYVLYLLVRGTVEGREAQALANASRVIDVQQMLRIFWEADLQSWIVRWEGIKWFVNTVYVWGHLPVIMLIAVWLYMFRRPRYALYRNAFLISGGISLVVFGLMPTAPPRLLPQWGFAGTAEETISYYIWQPPQIVNQYAAMPSLHFGWNVLVTAALLIENESRRRYAALLMPACVGAAAVLTANHFFLDLAAGAVICLFGLWVALRLHARMPASPLT